MNPNYTAHEQQVESELDQERYERMRHITEPGPRIEVIPLRLNGQQQVDRIVNTWLNDCAEEARS